MGETIDGNFSICSVDSANPSNFASYAYGSRRGIIDSLNSKMITSHTNVSTYAPRIVRWDLNSVTNPVPIDLSSVTNSAITTDLVIDALNSKLLVVSSNFSIPGGKAWLFRCNLDGTGCEEKDVSGGILSQFFWPKILLDTKYQKLLIFFYDISQFRFYVSRCDLAGDNCKTTQLFKTKALYENINEPNFDAVIDSVNDRALLLFAERDNRKLTMLRFGLGGF